MSCCCQKIHRLCDVQVCIDDLVLPIPIPIDGEYTLELEYLGQLLVLTELFGEGDNATFGSFSFNEAFTYVGHLRDPNGAVMEFTINGVQYDCFEFTTKRVLPYADPT